MVVLGFPIGGTKSFSYHGSYSTDNGQIIVEVLALDVDTPFLYNFGRKLHTKAYLFMGNIIYVGTIMSVQATHLEGAIYA